MTTPLRARRRSLPRLLVLVAGAFATSMLAWALWLSFALTRWVGWAWQVYAREGLWRRAAPGVRGST